MIQSIRQLFTREADPGLPSVPAGRRVYAVGDIHGRLDLFEAMIAAIERDEAGSGDVRSTVILLGDLVDRGPDSSGVIDRARRLQQERDVRILAGNHEEMFLLSFEDKDVLRHFLRFGGKETLLSYGIDARARHTKELKALQALMRDRIPRDDLEFVATFQDVIAIGGYAFVHAGIDPDVALEDQEPKNLRWIREPFLSHEGDHSHVIVHGHTISSRPELRGNRIGIDTGAFASGRLTALVLEGTARRLIETRVKDGEIAIVTREVVE